MEKLGEKKVANDKHKKAQKSSIIFAHNNIQ